MSDPKRIYKPSKREDPSATPTGGHPADNVAPKSLPFPMDCLPPVAAEMARAIARTERTPEALAGCCVMGFLSASIGAGLRVRSGPQRIARANLYILASAQSGSGKSESFRHAARPFFDFESTLYEKWKVENLPKVQAEADILESEIARLKKEAAKVLNAVKRADLRVELEKRKKALSELEPQRQAPILTIEDVTSERVAVMLANQGECLASVSPDAGAIVNILLGRYNKLDRTDESIYLKAWTGDKCRIDRQGRGPVMLNCPCLAALWLTQPDKVDALLKERSLTDGGLIPRILYCHTRAEPQPITGDASGIPAATTQGWANLVRGLLETLRLGRQPVTIEPTADAHQAMDDHWNAIVARWKVDLQDVAPFAARWTEQAWRIAVCLHAGLHGSKAGEHNLELDTAQKAIKLADWFASQQLEILAGSRMAARRAKLDEVLALLADNPGGIRASDVYRKRIVPTADEAHALLERVEKEGELQGRDEKPDGGGHTTRIYTKARK